MFVGGFKRPASWASSWSVVYKTGNAGTHPCAASPSTTRGWMLRLLGGAVNSLNLFGQPFCPFGVRAPAAQRAPQATAPGERGR